MNLLLISYGDYNYDGRLRELIKVFSKFGKLYCITRGSTGQTNEHKIYNGSYLSFIREAVAFGKNLDSIDVLVLDNRKSVLPGLILRTVKKPRYVVQDCRELYDIKDVKHFAGKVGCIVERWGINKSDVLIAANAERAEIMKEIFGLDRMPLVYENLRQLEYSGEGTEDVQRKKFDFLVRDDEIRILSSSGCSVSRTNDILVRNLDRVNRKCRLLLVGDNSAEDEAAIREIIEEKSLDNVEILGQISQDELKYLISVSHIGIVNYHQRDNNNKYCASGKVYEFIYEGIPVVTTTNPPLKNLCQRARIGQADDNYADGINQVLESYEQYQENVKLFAVENPVSANNARLQRELEELLCL